MSKQPDLFYELIILLKQTFYARWTCCFGSFDMCVKVVVEYRCITYIAPLPPFPKFRISKIAWEMATVFRNWTLSENVRQPNTTFLGSTSEHFHCFGTFICCNGIKFQLQQIYLKTISTRRKQISRKKSIHMVIFRYFGNKMNSSINMCK